MTTRIPLPGVPGDALLKGFDTGSNFMNRIIQANLQQARQQQLAKQFEQEMGLRERQFARSGANADIQRKIMEQQLLRLEHENDPMYGFDHFAQLMGGGNAPQNAAPSQLTGEGMGMFTPESLQEMQNLQGGQTPPNDMQALKKMWQRAQFKNKFKFDPMAEEDRPFQGAARNARDLERLKKLEGENSEVYKNAKAEYDAAIGAKKDLADLRERQKKGLKPGEKEFFDPETGEALGKEIALTAGERAAEEGASLFNELYPYVYKGAAPFSGKGSIRRLEKAAANYKSDPQARKMFDDFLLAEKMLAATTVNEAATLKAGKTNRTYTMLKESLEAQDIPKLVKKYIKEYKIPAEAQIKAGMRYQKALSQARKNAIKNIPATQRFFYNPEKQKEFEKFAKPENVEKKEERVTIIDPSGKRFTTTKSNAEHLPEGWRRG